MKLAGILHLLIYLVIALGIILTHSQVSADEVPPPKAAQVSESEYVFPNAEVFDLKSKEGREYRIFVATPEGNTVPSDLPVLYVLDANAYFPLAASLNRLRSRGSVGGAIVVGIGYPSDGQFDMQRRTFDMTTKADPAKLPPSRGGRGWPESGGADQFLSFIVNELKPRIVEKYSASSSDHAIVGHSFGGLFVMHAFFTQPNAFQTYIAISPSGWWNDYALLTAERQFVKNVQSLAAPKKLFIEVGELELAGNQGPAAALDPTAASTAFGTTADFANRLMQIKSDKLEVKYREFSGENHGTVVPPALIEAFHFAFPQSHRSGPMRRRETN
ncbi:alpha/beta hydrolase [Bremerella sp. T1]|uniref:alpha/beta hydrolase n=1 Tax=Bremerella sp. TYQ1 TaxID=3119568 RepID=UPI001CCE52B6|nr:alpha/beta hydrolase-fold protein [Bremerella volcania]UBM37054.1 hypothetical protein LA756_03970 [Bremerella volcania]